MKYINGNILSVQSGLLCHGVNCKGVMGAGLAKAIRDRYPKVYTEFIKNSAGPDMLGKVQFVTIGDIVKDKPPLVIANCYTQVNYGKARPYKGNIHADYDAIRSCINECLSYASKHKLTVHVPRIGCGLAGGSWSVVESIIKKEHELFPKVDVYHWELTKED